MGRITTLRALSRGLTVWGAGACLLTLTVIVICLGTLLIADAPTAATDKPISLMAIETSAAAQAMSESAEILQRPSTPTQTPAPQTRTKSQSNDAPVTEVPQRVAEADESATARGSSARQDADPADRMTFNGRPLKPVRRMDMSVTAYSPDARSCGKWADGITASGYSVWTNGMKLVAADTDLLPFGTIVTIPGYNDGKPVQVLDRGGKIKGQRLDVLYPSHETAMRWGRQNLNVTVWAYADE